MTQTAALSGDAEAVTPRAAGPCFEVYDPEFEAVLGRYARLALVAETDAHEGPVYIPREDALYFTTVPQAPGARSPGTPQAVIKRLALDGLSLPVDPSRLSVLPAPVHLPNGMTLGHDGRLVVCEQGTRSAPARISRVDQRTGRADTIVDSWAGLPLNSPNDVVVRRDGTIWFTDPSYGRPSALHLARAVPLQGGMPIVHAGHVAGAVGVSGASSADEDQELSMLAAEAASAAGQDDAAEGSGRAQAQPAAAQR